MQLNTRHLAGNTMKTLIASFLMFFQFFNFSCKSRAEKNVLPADKTQAILLDLHIAEAYSSMQYQDSAAVQVQHNKNVDSLARYYTNILIHHGVSYNDFVSTMDWYASHPALLDSIYASLNPKIDSIVKAINK